MEKKRLFKILSKAETEKVAEFAGSIKNSCHIVIVKEPEKSLSMVKMREPVKESLFYIGEVIICEAIVEVDGVKGVAVSMEDNFEKVLNMAIIDAACNKGIFDQYAALEQLEKEQLCETEKENAMFMKTKVDFHSMSAEG
ncbi:MAG: phosphonate C-P lyase system protein PhnG [Lachnospiraceae bacterium]|nr:phosphonate C-P lyase system protein PhnG [Lachnospiraceae bacterium]